jgi:exosome complex exonuclease DIS3/RRP44
MQRLKTFVKKSRTGRIIRVTREHYLREDIHCGSLLCHLCQLPQLPPIITKASVVSGELDNASNSEINPIRLSSTGPYYIFDTNVLLHQLDLIENLPEGLLTNVILLQTVLDEVKHNNYKLYNRCRALLTKTTHNFIVFSNENHRYCYVGEAEPKESANDRNDRAIRTATKYYSTHLHQYNIEIILVTEDRGNRNAAGLEKLNTLTIKQFVTNNLTKYPQLAEHAAKLETEESSEKEGRNTQWLYEEHIPLEKAKELIASGQLKRGTFHVNRDYWSEGSVSVRGLTSPVFIADIRAMNRAVDGDIVAVEILEKAQWKVPSKKIEPAMQEIEIVSVGNNETSAVTEQDVDNDMSAVNTSKNRVQTGRIVSIIQRKWRPYAGSLEVSDKKQGRILFLSVNKRIPRIQIESKQLELLQDKRILVVIDSWPRDSKFPLGHYTKTIGTIGEKETETQVLLLEHDIPVAPWTNAVLKCLPKDSHNIDQNDCKGRSDFRNIPIFSIDPPGCTDIDDALHVRQLPNGNYEVGVS